MFLNNIFNIRKNITEITHNQLNEKLGLINFNYDPKNIEDCSYVFGGYCPLSLRLIETAVEGKWNMESSAIGAGLFLFKYAKNVIISVSK